MGFAAGTYRITFEDGSTSEVVLSVGEAERMKRRVMACSRLPEQASDRAATVANRASWFSGKTPRRFTYLGG